MDLLYALKRASIRVITCRHELSAAFAADGYARASGKPGIVLVDGGPGCLNTLTALKTSYKDGIPVVMLIGTEISRRMNNEAEFQTVSFPNNIVRHVYTVRGDNIYKVIRESIHLSTKNPNTLVVIQIPLDISRSKCLQQVAYTPFKSTFALTKPEDKFSNVIRIMIESINESKKPLVIIGGGVLQSRSEEIIERFIHKYNIPAVCTSAARGVIREDDLLFLGTPGIIGSANANKILNESDLLLAFGTRLSNRFLHKIDTKGKKIFQINLEESHIRSDLNVIPVKFDVKSVLATLLESGVLEVKKPWKIRDNDKRFPVERRWGITPALLSIFKEIEDPIIFCDDGTYTVKVLQLYKALRPRTLLFSANMAAGGHALPGAIGAKFTDKTRKVIVITGDGGMLTNIGELQVYSENNLEILIVVFNNGGYDSINQWSQKYKVPLNFNFGHIDFTAIANGFGIRAYTIDDLETLEETVRDYQWDGPLLLNLIVPPERVDCHFPD